MSATRLPTSAEDLTPEWASQTLADAGLPGDVRVSSLRVTPVGEQGQTSQVLSGWCSRTMTGTTPCRGV